MPNFKIWEEVDGITYKTCPSCKKAKAVDINFVKYKKLLKNGKPKYVSWCKSCIAVKQASYHKKTWGKEKLSFTCAKRTSSPRAYLTYLRGKALRRAENCASIDFLCELYDAQQGLCALTGWPMTMVLGKGVISTNCSIDRIDSNIGYTENNIQLVCRAVNIAKHDLPQKFFVSMCQHIVDKNNGKKSVSK